MENAPLEKIYLSYGGLDMLPRVNMALKLARYAKWPQRMVKRIDNIRKELQGPQGCNGLSERRNQLVHGVHKLSTKPDCISLTMVRWEGNKRTQDVSLTDIHDLAVKLSALAQEAGSIFDDYGVWKFGPRSDEHSSAQGSEAETSARIIIAQNVKRFIESLFGK